MVAQDFRAKQLQANKIIASGSSGTPAKLLIYPESSEDKSNPNVGAINPSAFNTGSIGADVFMFVSGGSGQRGTSNPTISLFGGDVHISGTLTSTGPIFSDSGWTLTGSTLATTSSVMVGKSTKATDEGADVFAFFSGSVASKNTSTRGVTSVGGDLQVSGNIHTDGGINSFGGALILSSSDNVDLDAWDDIVIQSREWLDLQAGHQMNFVMRSISTANSGAFNFYDVKQGGTDGPGQASDVLFFVSGAAGSKDSSTRGTSLFAGDLHVSGNISVDGTIPGSIAVLHTSSLVVASASAINFSGSGVSTVSAVGNTVTVGIDGGAGVFSMDTSIIDATATPYDSDFGETVRVDNVSGAVQVNLPAAGTGDAGKQVKVINLYTLDYIGTDTSRNLSQLKAVQNLTLSAFTTVKTSTETIGLSQRDDGATNNSYLMRWNAEAIVFEFDGNDNWIIT
jgi:cytoskeletal protein CcmA (bactofilin family)